MEPQHEQALKLLLKKNTAEFIQWVGSLQDEELEYVEWLIDRAEVALDDLMFEEFGTAEADDVIKKIMKKVYNNS